jgi:tripartite-type tricarboxylate transporter receptor subunit TctC
MTSIQPWPALLVLPLQWIFLGGAQADPLKPVKLLAPFAAGGFTDMVARLLAERMGPLL